MFYHDNDILEACKQNDQKAQTTIYRKYVKAMYNTAFRIIQQSDKAEDAVQEAFIKAFSALESYRKESSFGSWLKRIVVNEALSTLRREKQSISIEEIHPPNIVEDNPQEVWDFQEEEIKILLYALGLLPERQRVILSLSLIEGYDNEEIMQILQISSSNCRTLLSRAKTSLRETIQNLKNDRK